MAAHLNILTWINSMDCIVHGVAKSWTRLSLTHKELEAHGTDRTLRSGLCGEHSS